MILCFLDALQACIALLARQGQSSHPGGRLSAEAICRERDTSRNGSGLRCRPRGQFCSLLQTRTAQRPHVLSHDACTGMVRSSSRWLKNCHMQHAVLLLKLAKVLLIRSISDDVHPNRHDSSCPEATLY